MVKKTIEKIKHPIIVFTGHHYCGKSYSAKLVKNDLDIIVNINRYDFITRILMYILNINPVKTPYNQITENYIDYKIMNDPKKIHLYEYAKDSVMLFKGLNKDIIIYILKNILEINNKNFENITEESVKLLTELSAITYSNNKNIDLSLFYKMSIEFYYKILSNIYDFNNKFDMAEYIDIVIKPYLSIQNYGKRFIYYAYSLNEVLYFKDKYNTPIIQIDMDHVIRSNLLATNNETNKLKLLSNNNYIKEMAAIKKESTAIIKNNYDFKKDISNKLKSVINF